MNLHPHAPQRIYGIIFVNFLSVRHLYAKDAHVRRLRSLAIVWHGFFCLVFFVPLPTRQAPPVPLDDEINVAHGGHTPLPGIVAASHHISSQCYQY